MNKNAIKSFAMKARRDLIARVSQRALKYGISEKETGNPEDDVVNGYVLSYTEKKQRAGLIHQIQEKGYEQVIEEVAYTWFNRFSALRFMEVNGYLPSRIRVFTDENNAFKPQILTESIHMDLPGLDIDKVYAYKEANDNDELYKYLLITQCNALNSILPIMFQKIVDYTELLFPDNLLRESSVVHQMIELIPEEDWKDAVQIIGWLYQYYNSEKKDDVFAALKSNVKISKENIPAATQLFTPDWIVRYMVENSLGRLWIEGHPDDELKAQWKYYLEEAEQTTEVQEQLKVIREGYKALKPEDILCIDLCSGSGHILVYMFDVLIQIYGAYGVDTRTAVASIIKNNIFGLDIDDRAAQLAYFSVMMKARQYDRRFFSRGIQPHVYAIEESNHVDKGIVNYFCNGDAKLTAAMDTILRELHDAKEYGSILTMTKQDWSALYARFDEIRANADLRSDVAQRELLPLVRIAETLAQKYDVVVTNPPYMGSSNMDPRLSRFVKKNYPDSKSDLFAVFIEVCGKMLKANGLQGMITQHAWMFLSSFEKLRKKLQQKSLINMAHLGARAFEEIGGEVVQTTSFVCRNNTLPEYLGSYCRLIVPNTQDGKEKMFLSGENRFISSLSGFEKTPGTQWAYWISEKVLAQFTQKQDYFETHAGITTGDNDYFLHLWTEIDVNHIYRHKQPLDKTPAWYFHLKGGAFRKWYGNNELVLHYDGKSIAEMNTRPGFRHDGKEFYFRECATWNKTGTGDICVRYSDDGNTFNTGGCCLFTKSENELYYIMGLLNSNVMKVYLSFLCPTFSFAAGDVAKIPIIYDSMADSEIKKIVLSAIGISKKDWDAHETSWDFLTHPFITYRTGIGPIDIPTDKLQYRIADAYYAWKVNAAELFNIMKRNEQELNRIFIDIYGLQDELTPEVADKDITVHRIFDTKDDVPESMQGSQYVRTKRDEVVSFISYAVGCMFGRYSLDADGLIYAGGEFDDSKYSTFAADKDNIIPICDDEYFSDDIVGRFVKFVEVVYGHETLQENLNFIADALGGKGQPKEVIRNYFLNGFYADHCKMYQKRPIYWMFDSGKKNGFKCLIYMHRYEPDLLARIRTDYVHEQQSRYHAAIADLESRIEHATTAERVKLNKQLKVLTEQEAEIHEYEEKIHHLADRMISIDLDDGVKNNYAIFKDVLAKIK
ncbi:MAG: BREX-1 system adenine-specific DNA-methyltransferase PglX [Dialister invisus]